MVSNSRVFQGGFTLIEIIVGMVALAVSMAIIIGLIVPTEQHSADQIHQIKASALGQSLLDEILGRAFDENSDHAGGHWRCNETAQLTCTAESNFGTDAGETSRSLFDDVDDYHQYQQHITSTDTGYDASYQDFTINVTVSYDGLTLGLSDNQLAKRITVRITTPLSTTFAFTGYKANF
jgi:MSHA pilin protein MshD